MKCGLAAGSIPRFRRFEGKAGWLFQPPAFDRAVDFWRFFAIFRDFLLNFGTKAPKKCESRRQFLQKRAGSNRLTGKQANGASRKINRVAGPPALVKTFFFL